MGTMGHGGRVESAKWWVSIEAFRPFLGAVEDGQYDHLSTDNGVGDDVGGVGNDQLAGALYSPRSAQMR